MLTSDNDLSESGKWTAWWVNFIDNWVLVVKICNSGGVKTLIDLDDEIDLTWSLGWRSDTLDLGAGNSLGFDCSISESARNVS
jgi:hypothetical protein